MNHTFFPCVSRVLLHPYILGHIQRYPELINTIIDKLQ